MFQCEKCKGFIAYPGALHTCEGEGAAGYVGPIPTVEFTHGAAGWKPEPTPTKEMEEWIVLAEIKDALLGLQIPLRDLIAMRLPDPTFHAIDEQRNVDKYKGGKARTDDEIKSFLRYRYADAMLKERAR